MTRHRTEVSLQQIIDAIDKIEKYLKNLSFDSFASYDMAIDAVLKEFEIVGEAVTRVPDEYKTEHPNIEWHKATGTRNRLIHGYDKINLEIVWATAKDDMPILKKQIHELLKSPVDPT